MPAHPIKKLPYRKPKIINLEKRVKNLEKIEQDESKYVDFPGNVAGVPAAGATQCINALGQGDSASNRTGNSVVGKNLQVKLTVQQTGATANQTVRVIIFLDKQPNGALPAVGGAGGVLQTAGNYQAFLNDGARARYRILMDKTFSVQTSGPSIINYKKFIPLRDIQTRYGQNLGTVADIQTNALGILYIGDTSLSTLTYNIRYRFVDN